MGRENIEPFEGLEDEEENVLPKEYYEGVNFNLDDVYRAEFNLRLLQNNVDSNISSLVTFTNSDSNIDATGFENKISCAKGDANCIGFQNSINKALERTIAVRNSILKAEGTPVEEYESVLEMNLEGFGEFENSEEITIAPEDLEKYVHDLLYDEKGNPKYPGMTIIGDPVVTENGNIQFTINVVENSRSSSNNQLRNNDITITINPSHTNKVFTVAPGTGGGAFYDLVNNLADENNFTTVSFNTAPTDTRVSDSIVRDIVYESNGNHNLSVAVLSGASAGVNSTVNMYSELMDIVDGNITIMLLDAADNGDHFKKELLERPDVVDHMKKSGNVIIAYESTRSNIPDNADPNWQELADNGITMVTCINSNMHEHSGSYSPEMQAVNGEVDDIMDPNKNTPTTVSSSNIPKSPQTGSDNSENQYAIYTPGGNGVYSGSTITSPASKEDVLNLLK